MKLFLRPIACFVALLAGGCATNVKVTQLPSDHPANPNAPAGMFTPSSSSPVETNAPTAVENSGAMEHHHGHE